MAIRSAYALGLHREETLIIFGLEEQQSRRNLWRTLYVLDRFLSVSLGRPVAISDDECTGPALTPIDNLSSSSKFSDTHSRALEAAVRSCRSIGTILKEVYQKRKISTELAQQISDECKTWPQKLAPPLHWRQASAQRRIQGVAILHVNLFYSHSIILLTRPFFLHLLRLKVEGAESVSGPDRARSQHMEKFSDACVVASSHTIMLACMAHEGQYLQRRNPWVK